MVIIHVHTKVMQANSEVQLFADSCPLLYDRVPSARFCFNENYAFLLFSPLHFDVVHSVRIFFNLFGYKCGLNTA